MSKSQHKRLDKLEGQHNNYMIETIPLDIIDFPYQYDGFTFDTENDLTAYLEQLDRTVILYRLDAPSNSPKNQAKIDAIDWDRVAMPDFLKPNYKG